MDRNYGLNIKINRVRGFVPTIGKGVENPFTVFFNYCKSSSTASKRYSALNGLLIYRSAPAALA